MKMRRFLAVSAIFILALTLCAGTALAQEKVIKIGAVYPLTGNVAATGMECKRGVDLAVEIINGKYDMNMPFAKTEGIPNLGGAKLQIIYADTQGDPKNGLAEAERLITQEKCVALIGTLFGGYSRTLFYILHRFTHGFHKDFQYEDEWKWINLYGIVEKITKIKGDGEIDDNAMSRGSI